ncbi:MAG TPA: hypothetical protein ENI23_16750, partial [bacterium]|nr:hypothetical protein [bacterium]
MADEIKEVEEIQEEVKEGAKEDEVKEEETKETKEVSDEEAKKSTISKIGDMVKNFVSSTPGVENEEEGELIPDDFSTAATNAGWTDKDITEFSEEYSNEELLEMIPTLKGEDSVETEQTSDKTETKSETKETKVEDSQEDEEKKKLLDRIDALEERQGKADKQTEQQKLSELDKRASQMFDKTSKEFKVFGKTETLPVFPAGPNKGQLIPTSPAMKARIEVWGLAYDLHKKAGMDFDNAMSVSLNAYKGKNLAKDVERNLIKDLKSREKK